MNKKRSFMWLIMQNKRLVTKPAFAVILLCIPILIFTVTKFAQQDSGAYKVVLCAQSDRSVASRNAIDRLKSADSIILFAECEDENNAAHMVQVGAADAAWIFYDDIDARLERAASDPSKTEPLVKVIEREDDVSAKLSHERLYASIYPELSYAIFKDHMLSSPYAGTFDGERQEYGQTNDDVLCVFRYLEGKPPENPGNYLTAPLKGFLAVTVILCGLSAQTLYLSDREKGLYDRIQPHKRIFAGAGITLAAVTDACIAVFISLAFMGNTDVLHELISLVCFSAASLAFCVFIGVIFRSHRVLGVCIPFLLLLILGISPVFFNMDQLRNIQMLLPTYYYQNSGYDLKYALYALIYAAIAWVLSRIGDRILTK